MRRRRGGGRGERGREEERGEEGRREKREVYMYMYNGEHIYLL